MRKFIKAEYAVILLFLCIFAYMFFVTPVVTIADNGDFERVMTSVGLKKFSAQFFSAAQIKYEIIPGRFGSNGYITTHALCVYIARFFNMIFYSRNIFDIRFLALIYISAMLCGIYYAVKALKCKNIFLNALLVFLMLFMLGDGGYTPYISSLYGEGCSYSFFIMSVGIALKIITDTPKKRDIFLLFFALIMFFGSKLQYTLLCPIALILIIPLYKSGKMSRSALAAGLAVLLGINVCIYAVAPAGLSRDTLYQSVFYGILKDSEDVHADAQSIGLEERYEYLAGTTAYDDTPHTRGDAEFRESFFGNIGRGTVIKYYITHIPRFWEKMNITTELAFDNLIGMFSNYTVYDGVGKSSFFTLYNSIKQVVFPNNFLTLCIIYVIYFVFLFRNRKSLYAWLILAVSAVGIFQFPLPIIGNGEADIAKQLYIFNLTFDIMLICAIYYAAKKKVLKKQ